MRRPFLVMVLAALLFTVMWGYGAFIPSCSAGGWWGMMGPNMMAGPGMWGGYSLGMMRGNGPAITSPGWNTAARDLNLSKDDVKDYFERWLAWQRNPRLKVGDVSEKDANAIVADIVTRDNSLVLRFIVSRRNGNFRPLED